MNITRETIRKVNQEMIMRNGRPKELSPLEKYADSIVKRTSDSFESKETQEEFNKLDTYKQKRLIIFAELRKDIKDKFSSPEKIKQACKDAIDIVLGKI